MNIQSIDDFFSDEIINGLDQEIKQRRWEYGWPSNPNLGYSHWNIEFANVIVENGLDTSTQLPDTISLAWQYISTQFPNYRLIRCYANSHTFGVEGYPHRDSNKPGELTLLVYMNHNWRREWGGETMVYNGNKIIHAEIPKRNTVLIFPGDQYHVSRGLTRICPELRITVMFKMSPLATIDPERDRIQTFLQSCNADKRAHATCSLCGHLLRVYDLLKAAKQSQVICNAGAMHSIFGTNVYQDITVPVSERDRVVAVVGEEATHLAELFSCLSRPATLERSIAVGNLQLLSQNGSTITVTTEELRALSAIESANLQDQKALSRLPDLHKFWQELNKV